MAIVDKALLVFTIAIGIIAFYHINKYNELKNEYVKLEYQHNALVENTKEERRVWNVKLDESNKRITEFELNQKSYIEQVTQQSIEIQDEYLQKQVEVIKELNIDSTDKKKLELINKHMQEFANAYISS